MDFAFDSLEDEGGRKLFAGYEAIDAFPEVKVILRQRGFRKVSTDRASGFRLWERG